MNPAQFDAAQMARGQRLAELHARADTLLLPNPWCAGAAALLEAAGFEALATTGAGMAFARAKPDKGLSQDELLGETAAVCRATSLPVTADYQDCFAAGPEDMDASILAVARQGAVGCSIEDVSGDGRILPVSQAVERVQAAVEAAHRLPFPFVITARADNFFEGVQDLDDTLRRLQAYERAGAHALYAPGLKTVAQVETVARSVGAPLNVLLHGGAEFGLQELRSLGVCRVSIGGYLARVALGAAVRAAEHLRESGRLDGATALAPATLNRLFSGGRAARS